MKRIIKLTEKQLNEATDNGFNYLNGGDVPNYSGQTFISATGKIKQDEYGKPTTSDMVGNSLSSQTFDRYNLTTQTYRQKTNENDEFLPNLNKEKKTNIDDSNDIEDAEARELINSLQSASTASCFVAQLVQKRTAR